MTNKIEITSKPNMHFISKYITEEDRTIGFILDDEEMKQLILLIENEYYASIFPNEKPEL